MNDGGNLRRPLRGAIIGLGNVAVYAHLPVWQRSEDFTIDAIVEPTAERAEIGKRLLPQARIYPTMAALLAENGVDFVDICTPPAFTATWCWPPAEPGCMFCVKNPCRCARID